jgi:hypothetical protein
MSNDTEVGAAADVRFLDNLQRILAESRTNSTYKYALLIALADICVEDASGDDRAELTVPVTRIAEKFLELYWRHGLPYGSGLRDSGGGMLSQNRGGPALVSSRANQLRAEFGSLAVARRCGPWQRTVKQLARHLKEMPLWRLQRLRTETLDFLYPECRDSDAIMLRPGVAAAFRRFHTLVLRLVQAEWMAFLHGLPGNQVLLGHSGDLAEFLFGPQRESLAKARPALSDLQQGRCFYCRRSLTGAAEIDHFIPWSRYPRNLVHNLVLADRTCNGAKSDVLAGDEHLQRWLSHAEANDPVLIEIGATIGLPADLSAALHVADWCYGEARRLRAEVWIAGSTYARLGGD